ncbi:MAG: hypothetical protein QW734_08950 [Candidatus Bathyarchaeia archaeon]
MAKFLVLESNYTGQFYNREIIDGKVRIGNYEWYVDGFTPFSIKKPFGGEEKFYILSKKSLYPVSPKDLKIEETPVTPHLLKRIVELKIFDFLLKRIKSGEEPRLNYLQVAMFVLFGVVLGYILVVMKVLPVR